MTRRRQILATSALPYANGPIHIGHLLEYIQTDIWVRFQRLRGHECHYVCADDAHGTPIMLKAQEEGISPEELIARVGEEHRRDFDGFLIEFDSYYSTHSEENRRFSNLIYERLRERGLISSSRVVQAYDEQMQVFLPDRFIRGDCPRCASPDQYGDCCEVCGATYTPAELKNARSVLSDTVPSERESEHYFFELPKCQGYLEKWLSSARIQPAIRRKLGEWFEAGLRSWDISRDAPYFGFEIPDRPGKYFYVWLDAPVGYMASFQHYCDRTGKADFDHYWQRESPAELHHFIGKDIAYFHALFWPAMLDGAGFRKPTAVHCHGFVTVDRKKMSKSRGTFITARAYLDHLDPEYLRYYFAARLTDGVEDVNFNPDDFVQRVNSDLVGKIVNIASRCSGFIHRYFNGELMLAEAVLRSPLYRKSVDAGERIAGFYDTLDYAAAVREVTALADQVNQYIDRHKPWEAIKQDSTVVKAHEVCSVGLLAFARIVLYLKPVLPEMSARAEDFLQIVLRRWDEDVLAAKENHRIGRFRPLMTRVEADAINAMMGSGTQAKTFGGKETGLTVEEITLDTFQKVDLRVARVVNAENVEDADRLLRLEVDLGGETREVFAGIKGSYTAAELVGRMVVVVANMKPRKMRFGVSQGMLLAAGQDEIFLLSPDEGACAGMKIK